ncbi:MAG: photosynthetic reaction center cytochrome c subunit [Acidobacteria bacterium]|nr:photosynthetic reaction center cytochrome c subunit [Acidobacteriota bacterium]
MKINAARTFKIVIVLLAVCMFAFSRGIPGVFAVSSVSIDSEHGSATPTPTPDTAANVPAQFDGAAAVAKLREQIKGHEQDPAASVWKNIQIPFIKSLPAGRVLAVMQLAYSSSLGVTCTHCHVPDKWESDENPNKQVTRAMSNMMTRINGELLKSIPNLSANATINCTTCHRGQVKPALNLPPKN